MSIIYISLNITELTTNIKIDVENKVIYIKFKINLLGLHFKFVDSN